MKAKITASALYAVSFVLLALYIVFTIGAITVHPFQRAFTLVSSCLFLYFGTLFYCKKLNKKEKKKMLKLTWTAMLVMYLSLVFTFTWLESYYGRIRQDGLFIWDLSSSEREIYFKTGYQDKIFATLKRMYNGYKENRITLRFFLQNIVGNLLLLMPMGYFFPKLFKKQRNSFLFLITILFTAVLIEGVQLVLMIGVCDIDDLLLNITGAMLLYFILKIPIFKPLLEK